MTKLILALLLISSVAFAKPKIQNEDVKGLADIKASVLTTTGNLSSGSPCIASPGSTSGLSIGQFVYDFTNNSYIPSGTTIIGLPGTCPAGQIKMSANATNNATGDTITFGGQESQLINDTKIYDTSRQQLLSQTLAGGEYDAGNSGTSKTIDFLNGQSQKVVLTGNVTFTFTNATFGVVYVLRVVQDPTGGRTMTFPASIRYPSGVTPTYTTTANHTDMILIYYSPGIGSGARYITNVILDYTE